MVLIVSFLKVATNGGIPEQGVSNPTPQPNSSNPLDTSWNFIKNSEKFSEKAYGDYKQTSIGYGTAARPGETRITKAEAEKRGRAATRESMRKVQQINEKYGYNFTPNQIAALTSFGYNLGPGRLEQLVKGGRRNPQQIAKAMIKYNRAGGKVNKGLINRRNEEVKLFWS